MIGKIRILHAITRLDKGGSSTNTLLSAEGLAKKGYEVDLLYGKTADPDTCLLEKARDAGVDFIEERSLVRNIHPFMDMVALVRIARIIRKRRYDVVHAHSSKAGLIARVAAKLGGVKKIVYTPHGHVFYGYFSGVMTGCVIFAEKMAAGITDRIVGLTVSECEEWLRFGVGKSRQYLAIPSGIDFSVLDKGSLSGHDWRKKLAVPDNAVLVGSIGRFIEIKGYEYFIKAASGIIKQKRNVYFILVGDGPLKEKYEGMIKDNALEKHFFIIPWQENTGAILKEFDIFVLSSLNEGMGRALIEAMFFGKPVIATHVGGVPSVVTEGSGILIEPASAEAISQALDELLDNPEKARNIGKIGREKAIREFSVDVMVDKLDELYGELLA